MDPRVIMQLFIMASLCILFYDEPAVLVGIILAQIYLIVSLLRDGNQEPLIIKSYKYELCEGNTRINYKN